MLGRLLRGLSGDTLGCFSYELSPCRGPEPKYGLLSKMFHERPWAFRLELHGPLGNMGLAFLQVHFYGFVKRLAREFAPRLRSILALLDFGDAILFELFRLPFISCVQRLAITNAVDRYIEVPMSGAFVDHAAPFSAGFFSFALTISLPHQWSWQQPRRRLGAQTPTTRDLRGDSVRASRP